MPKLSDEQIQEIYEEIIALPFEPVKKEGGDGRPSKYKDELILDLLHYFNIEAYDNYTTNTGVRSKNANDLPTIDGWCYKQGITDQTYQNWRKVNPRFAEAANLVVLNQRDILITNSLHNNYNANFASLIGRIKYGWDTKTDEDNNSEINTIVIDADDAKL